MLVGAASLLVSRASSTRAGPLSTRMRSAALHSLPLQDKVTIKHFHFPSRIHSYRLQRLNMVTDKRVYAVRQSFSTP